MAVIINTWGAGFICEDVADLSLWTKWWMKELTVQSLPFDVRNSIGTFGQCLEMTFGQFGFLLLMQGGRIYCDVPFLIGLKDTYMTICDPILVLNS